MNILKKFTQFITDTLYENNIIQSDEIEIYTYCFDYLFENILYFLIIIFFGVLSKKIYESIIFLSIILPAKTLAGGFHAPTPRLCNIISYSIAVAIIIIFPHLYMNIEPYSIVIFVISCFLMICFAPVDCSKKQLTRSKKHKLKLLCVFYVLGILIFSNINFIRNNISFYNTIIVCVIIIVINQIIGCVVNFYKYLKGEYRYDFERCNMR